MANSIKKTCINCGSSNIKHEYRDAFHNIYPKSKNQRIYAICKDCNQEEFIGTRVI